MPISTARPERPRRNRAAFTILELMIASSLALIILSAVLGTHLHLVKSGVQITRHAEMEAQLRRSLEQLGNDLRNSRGLTWNNDHDITLDIVAIDGTSSPVTYAWSSTSQALYRVPGTSSASNTGRIYLATGIPPNPDGSAGARFVRYDRNNAVAASTAAAKRIQISMTLVRDTPALLPPVSCSGSAGYILRNKPGS